MNRIVHNKRCAGEGQRGFTLIEIMFATAVIGLVVGGAMYALLMAFQLSEDSKSRLIALNAARSTLEAIKDTPIGSVSTLNTSSYVPSDLPGASITITTNPATITSETVGTVTVTVNWTGAKGMNKSLTISTMRSAF